MKPTRLLLPALLCSIVLFLVPASLMAQISRVTLAPDTTASLANRWSWAVARAATEPYSNGCWIGYSISKMMAENAFIGTFYHPPREGEEQLDELLYGPRGRELFVPLSDDERVRQLAENTLNIKEKPEQQLVRKHVAILLLMLPVEGKPALSNILYSNMSLRAALENLPVIWLAGASDAESVPLLRQLLARETDEKRQSRLISAIGLHDSDELVLPPLREAALRGGSERLRKDALSRLARRSSPEVLPVLEAAAYQDASADVQKHAVYRIANYEGKGNWALLQKIAGDHPSIAVRRSAINRLAKQDDTEQASRFLQRIAFEDAETALQKEAVHRLSQLPSPVAVPLLTRIATEHRDPAIRKDAIYRLSRCDSAALVLPILEKLAFELPDRNLQQEAVYRIGRIDAAERVAILTRIGQKHPNVAVRKTAIQRLGKIDDPAAAQALLQFLDQK